MIVRPKYLIPALVLTVLALVVAGCGGSGSSSPGSSSESTSTTRTTANGKDAVAKTEPTGETGKVEARWQKPHGEANVTGYELLKESETVPLAKSLATAFELPHPC